MNWIKIPNLVSNIGSCKCQGATCQGRDTAQKNYGCGVYAGQTNGFCLINFS